MFISIGLLELACQKLSSFDESINESSPFCTNSLGHGIDSNGISTTDTWLATIGCTVGSVFCRLASSSFGSLFASISQSSTLGDGSLSFVTSLTALSVLSIGMHETSSRASRSGSLFVSFRSICIQESRQSHVSLLPAKRQMNKFFYRYIFTVFYFCLNFYFLNRIPN